MKKQGIMIGSFGTTYDETRRKTIDVLGEDIAAMHPDAVVVHAFTSGIVRGILSKRNAPVFSVTQAAAQMLEDQITHLVVQPTHLLDGIEFEKLRGKLLPFVGRFESLKLGRPLLSSSQDLEEVAELLHHSFSQTKGEALLLMGHGSAHRANDLYTSFLHTCTLKGYDEIFMGTVEGTPTLADAIAQLKERKIGKVHLLPFMLVAGDHAIHDMAGAGEDSWKNQLEALGFEVSIELRGLGEYEGIRKIYIRHLHEGRELTHV